MTKRIVVSGGGDAPETIEHHLVFAHWLNPRNRILYIPGGAFPVADSVQWLSTTFREFGNFSIQLCDVLSGNTVPERSGFDGIYIGGGNTFTLLDAFRRYDVDEQLYALVLSGCPVFGGSAGAIMLGRDLMTCIHMDPNEVGLIETTGLDLIEGHAIWCHYDPAQAPRVQRFADGTGHSVFALPENGGIVLDSEKLTEVGPGRIVEFIPRS